VHIHRETISQSKAQKQVFLERGRSSVSPAQPEPLEGPTRPSCYVVVFCVAIGSFYRFSWLEVKGIIQGIASHCHRIVLY